MQRAVPRRHEGDQRTAAAAAADLASCSALTADSLELLHLSRLQRLTALTLLGHTSLTDSVGMHLSRLTRLQQLDISDCPGVSEAAVDSMHPAMPRLQTLLSNGIDDMIPLRALGSFRLKP